MSSIFEEATVAALAIQMATPCDCGHAINLHHIEDDEYGVFVADCKVKGCDCKKFGSEKFPGLV